MEGLAGLAGLCLGAGAFGQASPDTIRQVERQLREIDRDFRLSAPADQPIAERMLFDYGGSLRISYLSVDNQFSRPQAQRQYDVRVYARLELDGAHRFYGRLKFQYDDFNSGESFDGDGDDWNDPFLDRLWYEFDYRGLIQAKTGERTDWNFNVKGGKEYYHWGSGLVLSQVLYGGTLDLEFGDLGFTFLGGETSPLETVDFDSSRQDFDDDTKRLYLGGQLEWRGTPTHRPYAFFMSQTDNNTRTFQNIGGAFPTSFGYDSYYAGLGSRGSLGASLRYRAEFVYEFGETLSSSFDPGVGVVPQTTDDISAMAGLFGLTYLFRDEQDTRLDLELIAGSGDDDRIDSGSTFGGNAPGTEDNAFNSLGYVNTGLALSPDVSNLLSIRLGMSTSPFRTGALVAKNLRIGVDGFVFFKIDDQAPLSVATVPGDGFVGGEVDVFLDWRLLSDFSIIVRYGAFLPGDAMPPGQDDYRDFFYIGGSYAF